MKLTRKAIKEMGLEPASPSVASKHPWSSPKKKRKPKDINCQGRDQLFDRLCTEHGLPPPVHEFRFHPERQWRLDYVFDGWLALEVEGGAWIGGRHVSGSGFLEDMQKYNEAVLLGYVILRCTPQAIESGAAFALVKRALDVYEEQA